MTLDAIARTFGVDRAPPTPPTREDASSLALDMAMYNFTVQEKDGRRVDPRTVLIGPGQPGAVPYTFAPDVSQHRRQPGARTLGGWRRKVMLPEVAAEALDKPDAR